MNHRVTRREFVGGVAALAAAACSRQPPAEQAAAPPHIILLMGDDHGWEETGYYDHPYVKTPVLDEMAASALRLDNFHSAAPFCSPTRASIMTGRHPNRSGVFVPNATTRPEEITIAQLLKQHGYATGHFGKWHLGTVKAESPLNPRKMGFDEYLSHDNFFENNPTLSRNGAPPERIEGEGSEVVIDAAIKFIDEKSAAGQPTFTVVWFGSPHEPYVGLPEDMALYDGLPEQYAGQTTVLTSLETGVNATRPLGEVLRERYAEITAMDRAIGKLRDHLAEAGLRDNTLVWYCGDNGTPPDAQAKVTPLRGMKSDMYEGGLRSPSIIEWPARITAPRVSTVNSVTTDTMATLLDIVDAPLPDRPMDGISLLPLIDGEMEERPEPIMFWNYPLESLLARNPEPYIDPALQRGTTPLAKLMDGEAVRTFYNYKQPEIIEEDYTGPRAVIGNRYKLVLDGSRDSSGVELFDMTADLGEETNIADANPEIVADYQQRMRTWQESVLNSVRGSDY